MPEGMVYHVTGLTTDGGRFKLIIESRSHAMSINLWRGSVWEVVGKKRKLIKRVWN